jgi:NAD(P)-dependent dehydrogenase (short-subunit alcohol dehydrogenase family)
MSIENRVVVVTGATGGLGRVVARQLAERGARLALMSTNEGRLSQLARDLQLPEDRGMIHSLDAGNKGAVQVAANAVIQRFGRADILLHLVGGWTGGKPVVEVEPGEVSDMLYQHLWTTLYLAQAFVPHMVANKWGRVIAISSQTASRPAAKRAPYAVGKVAQEALMLTLAQELVASGVTANLIVVNTIDVQHERDRAPTPANAAWTTPEEITAAILYLCSDKARTVNGARLPLYGSP